MFRRLEILVIIVLALGFIALEATPESSAHQIDRTSQSSMIHFASGGPGSFLALDFAANLKWDSEIKMTANHSTPIGYTFEAGPADLRVLLPLGDYLGFCGVKDVSFRVPLGETPLEPLSISLTGSLGVPKSIASVNLVLVPQLSLADEFCSRGASHLKSLALPLVWTDWAKKSVGYQSFETGQTLVLADFSYTLSISVTLTLVSNLAKIDLLPAAHLVSIHGSMPALTTIEAMAPTPSWLARNGLVMGSFFLEFVGFYGTYRAARYVFGP